MSVADRPTIGVFGKIPARGDFVTRGLGDDFLLPWIAWVEAAVIASRTLLGGGWTEAWLIAPVWRFALRGGTCGARPVLGVMLPSVDRVGRSYPLVGVAQLPVGHVVTDRRAADDFLDAMEDLLRSALADDLDPITIGSRIDAITPPPVAPGVSDEPGRWWTEGAPRMPPHTLLLDGLPVMPDHAAMLAGGPSPGGACA